MRMIFATFAAAFFGNGLYHFTRDWEIIRDMGLWKAHRELPDNGLLQCPFDGRALYFSNAKTQS